MRRRSVVISGLAALASLMSGCALFGDDEEETAAAAEAEPAATGPIREPVAAVGNVEIGRTRSGIVITAFAEAPGLGYSRPVLLPRRDGQPDAEGILDYDFFVTPPDPNFELPPGQGRALQVRADLMLSVAQVRAARGLRVHGLSRGVLVGF
ncbi:MAG: hypothetical protein ACFBSD_05600 [Paracoccaceae bacterium]